MGDQGPLPGVAQVLPGAGNAAALATQVAALARRPSDQLLQLLRAKGEQPQTKLC